MPVMYDVVPPQTVLKASTWLRIPQRAFDPISLCWEPDVLPSEVIQRNLETGFFHLQESLPITHFVDCIAIFIDGFCIKEGGEEAAAGVGVYFGPNDKRNYSEPLPDYLTPTTHGAEIHSAVVAVRLLHGILKQYPYEVVLVTHSGYLFKAMTEWIYEWRKNDYVAENGSPIKNAMMLRTLDREWSELEEKFRTSVRI
jgi:ribonuclease HI